MKMHRIIYFIYSIKDLLNIMKDKAMDLFCGCTDKLKKKTLPQLEYLFTPDN